MAGATEFADIKFSDEAAGDLEVYDGSPYDRELARLTGEHPVASFEVEVARPQPKGARLYDPPLPWDPLWRCREAGTLGTAAAPPHAACERGARQPGQQHGCQPSRALHFSFGCCCLRL